jgi:hypothetical protein
MMISKTNQQRVPKLKNNSKTIVKELKSKGICCDFTWNHPTRHKHRHATGMESQAGSVYRGLTWTKRGKLREPTEH